MATLDTTGEYPTTLYYTDTGGSGRPIVLIHGWPASGQSWQQIADPLVAAGHRVVAYDRRGFGRSGQPEGGYDYDTFADDLDTLLTRLDLVDVALAGFSMGGGEVARYIARHGTARVTAAVFVAAIPPCLDATLPDNPEGGFTPQAAAEMQVALRADPESFLTGFLTNFYSVPVDSGSELKVDRDRIEAAIRVARQASLTALAESIELWLTDFRGDLGLIRMPTLVIHGAGDQIVPIQASGARMPQYGPGARLISVPDGPHGLLHSHPGQVSAALLDFLD